MIVEGYKNTLLDLKSEGYDLIIETANNCDEGVKRILNSKAGTPYDILFLDVQLPPSKDEQYLSGEDLGMLAKKELPNAKIVFLTMFDDNFRMHNIFKNVDPDGFLVKSDVNTQELVEAFETVVEDPPYYSKSVTKFIRSEISNRDVIDDLDRKILFHISKGVQTKDLPEHINLSINAIEKRKRVLRKIFEVDNRNDISLIQRAKEQGFL